jgi:MFS transporter, DHA3 family, macrolide efflux protein
MSKKNSSKSMGRFAILWSGQLVSAIGSGMTAFALGVYVFRMTGQVSDVSLVTLLAFLPPLLLGPFAGVLADRMDRRLLMILGDSLSVFGLLYILYCLGTGGASLWQICAGVLVSSVFTGLTDPAYRATVTDMLSPDEFTKASGLVQIAGAAKYLISPIIAGFLMKPFGLSMILWMDVSTFVFTVLVTFLVRKDLKRKTGASSDRSGSGVRDSFFGDFREGVKTATENRGIIGLTFVTCLVTFFMGFIQILSSPMVLAFESSEALGSIETIAAMGMLVSGIVIGIFRFRRHYVRILWVSLFAAGIFMVIFGLRENLFVIGAGGFLFFAALPFSNMALDYLVRTNIPNDTQGRVWPLISLVSQFGYVVSYILCGVLADKVFTPMMVEGGVLASSAGRIIGIGAGRGTALLLLSAGVFLAILAPVIGRIPSIRRLEKEENECLAESSAPISPEIE